METRRQEPCFCQVISRLVENTLTTRKLEEKKTLKKVFIYCYLKINNLMTNTKRSYLKSNTKKNTPTPQKKTPQKKKITPKNTHTKTTTTQQNNKTNKQTRCVLIEINYLLKKTFIPLKKKTFLTKKLPTIPKIAHPQYKDSII